MFGRNKHVLYRVFDNTGRFVLSFRGNANLILHGTQHGKLTQNELNEPMLIVGANGISIEASDGVQHVTAYLYKDWKLVQKS